MPSLFSSTYIGAHGLLLLLHPPLKFLDRKLATCRVERAKDKNESGAIARSFFFQVVCGESFFFSLLLPLLLVFFLPLFLPLFLPMSPQSRSQIE